MKEVNIEEFLLLSLKHPIIDVRSPAEFIQGHILGAQSLPLFDDKERSIVGTIYKQQGQEQAIEKGLEFVGHKLVDIYKKSKVILAQAKSNKILIHCWRGGKRSSSVASFLSALGVESIILEGGYKSYRAHVHQVFTLPYKLLILGGKTGSAKTDVLHELRFLGEQMIDLEGLANHKGSAFGSALNPKDNIRSNDSQPSTEHFENLLATELFKFDHKRIIWVENESRLIGRVHLPLVFLDKMNIANYIKIEVPTSMRIHYLAQNYGVLPKDFLRESAKKITKRIGGQRLTKYNEFLDSDDIESAVEVILDYYDRTYEHSSNRKTNSFKYDLVLNTIDAKENAKSILQYAKEKKLLYYEK